MNLRSATVIAALAASPLCVWAQNAQQYSLTDLGTLGGNDSYGYGISPNGQVTGYAYTAENAEFHAFLYSNGTMEDLGTLGGTYSRGSGINSAGQVAGFAYTTGNASPHAFLYSNGTMQDLGTLGGTLSRGSGINSAGQVTGYAYTTTNIQHAFLYSNGTMEDLGTLGGALSAGVGINSAGQVTGYAYTTGNAFLHAFLYSNGTMQDLGTLGGTYSVGGGINSAGQVTGYAYTTGNASFHAFLYSNGTMQDLGTLGGTLSRGSGINSAGQVTGYAYIAGDVASHAFLYSNGTTTDLNVLIDPSSPLAPYVTLYEGLGINDNGLIVANGIDSRTAHTHAYLLTPLQEGIADCAHIGDVAPLFDAVFDRRASQPDVYEASFASQAEPGIMCVDNGINGTPPVTAGSVFLNAKTVVGPDDLKRNATASPIEVRMDLLQENELTVRLASKPGAEIRVRVFKALPASTGSK